MVLAALPFYDFIISGYFKALGRSFMSFYLWHMRLAVNNIKNRP